MARSPRGDAPGVWHHVMNRGIARRTVFEDRRDVRYFLSHLARVVRAGWIEVHAYCVLTTHFHLLVKSSDEGVSRAMGRVQNNYVRWFNRGRRRDGPLFRSRFRSRPVETLEYRRQLVRYIDTNPVEAGLVPTPVLYPHGSAQRYAVPRGPLWLERSWIEQEVREFAGDSGYEPEQYLATFGEPIGRALGRVIERRIESGLRAADPLDDLLGAAPERVLDWMRRKAALADGTKIDLPICDAVDVLENLASERALRPTWRVGLTRKSCDAWRLVEVALARDLCGVSWAEIGVLVGTSDQGALSAYRQHARALEAMPEYAEVVGRLSAQAITRWYGARTCVGASAMPSV